MVTTRQTDPSSVAMMAPTVPKSSLAKASASSNKTKKRVVVVARPPVPRSRVAIKKPTTKFAKKGAVGASISSDTCEVVKMLTGTLYLYRGAQQRRVEFVRKF